MNSFQQLGRYLLIEKIGSGGMADVYRSKLFGVEGFEKDVAIKKILPHWSGNRDFVEMLIDEAKVLLHLTHANIVQVFELNKEEDIYYIVMEYVDGVDLRTLIRKIKKENRSFSIPVICHLTQLICNGLAFAHEKKDRSHNPMGIVHRDISPQNILLSYEGEVKITDFGIAKILGRTSETVTGTLKGKFAYMSPEQAMGQKIDCRTDIFSLGILLYEMVTGERCFKGAHDLETLEAVRQAHVSFSQEQAEKIPERLRHIILKALDKDPQKRFHTIAEMRAELRAFENQMGFINSDAELIGELTSLFKDRIAEKHQLEEALSVKTKLHFHKSFNKKELSKHRTKVLVGDTKIIEGVELSPTVISLVKTVVFEKTLPALTSAVVEKVNSIKAQRKYYFYALFLPFFILLVGGIFYYTYSDQEEKSPALSQISLPPPENFIPPTEEKILPEEQPPVEAHQEEEAIPLKEAYGSLKVGAHPWGKVFLSGIAQGAETPFSQNHILVGDYDLKVVFPPLNKTVATRVSIKEDGLITCQAQFGVAPRIWCR